MGNPNKKAILVVSFGTSYNESRENTIGAVERAVAEAFPDYDIRRAFTSRMIIDKLKARDGLVIDTVEEAVKGLAERGYGDLVVLPTHVMNGTEYDDMVNQLLPYKRRFEKFALGNPVLGTKEDFTEVVGILAKETECYTGHKTAIVFMGHGTDHEANVIYSELAQEFKEAGYGNYVVGTVEASPSLEDVIRLVGQAGAKKVVLIPLMIVAGDHVSNDMAGDEEDSWKSRLLAAGYEVECVMKGLGEYREIQQLFVKHVQQAMVQDLG